MLLFDIIYTEYGGIFMKVLFQGKEIELECSTEEEMSLDYLTPQEQIENNNINLDDTIEITEDMQEAINGDQNE